MVTFESATDRLGRLLTMVPWLLHNQGIDIAEAAQTFTVSTEQIADDLQLLFVCGTPGHLPDDLIEASWEGGKVFVGNAETIARPLRLGRDEALAVMVALRALASVPGLGEHGAITRALSKLQTASGHCDEEGTSNAISVTLDTDEQQRLALTRIRAALADQVRLHLRYVVPARDEVTERDVDPMRVLSVDGRWYVEAWCHHARDVRLFRLDRIEHLSVLDVAGVPPPDAVPRQVGPGVFSPSEHDTLITMHVAPSAAWVAEQFPVHDVQARQDGSLRVQVLAADPRWIVRLVWRLGGQVRVLEPSSVLDMVCDGAQRALESGLSRPE